MLNRVAGEDVTGSSPVNENPDKGGEASFLAFAKQIEIQGRDHYSMLARDIPIPEISGIFTFLADEEQRHFDIFDSWEKKAHLPSIINTQVLVKSHKAFQKLWEQFREAGLPAMDYFDAYEKALAFENKSVVLYESQLTAVEASGGRDQERTILKNIIHQEKAHAFLITCLMEFNRAPGEWLENAEWYHLDEF
jgi:rubrerythrin